MVATALFLFPAFPSTRSRTEAFLPRTRPKRLRLSNRLLRPFPLGTRHNLKNPYSAPRILITVAMEDVYDLVRNDGTDLYLRVEATETRRTRRE